MEFGAEDDRRGEYEVEDDVEEEEDDVEEPAGPESGPGGPGGAAREAKPGDGDLSSMGKIFVGGVAWETTEETFAAHFEKYGEIIDSVIMRDKHTQMPRGFGFITFADPSVIDKVLEDEHNIDGKTVEVKRTVPREEMPSKPSKTKKIFIGGIPPSLSEDELKDHFSSYGRVIEHQIMVDHSTGRSRGFGFVTFEKVDAVDKLISEGRMHELAGKQVEIKRAEPKRPGGDMGNSGSRRSSRGNNYSYGGGGPSGYNRSGSEYYGGGVDYGYGRGYAAYGGYPAYGAGYGAGYGGAMFGGAGYGGAGGYAGAGAYGSFYGVYGSGRGYGNRYHPYSK